MSELENRLLNKINPSSITWETLTVVETCCSCMIKTLGSSTDWGIWQIYHWPAVHWIWNSMYSPPGIWEFVSFYCLFFLFAKSLTHHVCLKTDHSTFNMCDIITQKFNWPSYSRLWDSLYKKHSWIQQNILCSITLL